MKAFYEGDAPLGNEILAFIDRELALSQGQI